MDYDDFIQIRPMTLAEQREMLLRYFAVLLDGMTPEAIGEMRARFLKSPACGEKDTIIEVIDGHLAANDQRRPLNEIDRAGSHA